MAIENATIKARKLEVERNDNFHAGHACYRQRKDGGVTVMCPYGHLVASVGPASRPHSTWYLNASYGTDVVICQGKLKADAEPYPFDDTVCGRRIRSAAHFAPGASPRCGGCRYSTTGQRTGICRYCGGPAACWAGVTCGACFRAYV